MAEITSAIALQFATDARSALVTAGRASSASTIRTPNAGDLPSALAASRRAGTVTLSVEGARTAVARALRAGYAILNALQTLQGNAQVATQDGLVSPSTNLRDFKSVTFTDTGSVASGEGTRISRINIQAGIKRAVQAIDDLVAQAGFGSANLISSSSPRIGIQTTQFGGQISVDAQPLDSLSLGLRELDTLSHQNAVAAVARISGAVGTVSNRIDILESLQRNLGFSDSFDQAFSRIDAGGFTQGLARGSLVDLIA